MAAGRFGVCVYETVHHTYSHTVFTSSVCCGVTDYWFTAKCVPFCVANYLCMQ